ncbi:MAG: hypothetical protein V1720_20450 [bacterium]
MVKIKAVVVLLFLIIISANQISRAEGRDTLYLKKDSVICSRIQKILPQAVTLIDNRSVSLEIVSEIRTSDTTIVTQIKSFYPEVVVTRLDSIFIIGTKDISIPPSDTYHSNVVHRYFFILNAMSDKAENFEFQMNMVPRFWNNLIFQVTVSSGLGLEPNGLSLNQISAGLGFLRHYGGISLAAVLNVGHKTLEKKNWGIESGEVVSLSLNGLIPIINDAWLLAVGSRVHLNNIPVNGNTTSISFNLGVGYNIQMTPD